MAKFTDIENWSDEECEKFDYPAFELQCSTADFDMSNGLSYIFGNGLNIEVIGNIYENHKLLEAE